MNNNHKLIVILFCIVLLISGCAVTVPTYISTMSDPTFQGRTFKRILVIANFENTEVLKGFEIALVNKLMEKGIYAVANHKVLPPIRDYTDEEKINVFKQHNLDSYIFIAPESLDMATINIPTVSETKGSATAIGNTAYGRSKTKTYEGGNTEIATAFNSHIKLYDLTNGNAVWQGDAVTKLNIYAGVYNIINSIAPKVVEKLEQDGIIIIKKEKE